MSPSALLNGSGHMNGHAADFSGSSRRALLENSSHLQPTDPEALHDLICVGFGPASLAIAAALHDALATPGRLAEQRPKVAFLERQAHFSWHDGMLLPDARMQISFVKDMATLRDPQSEFTFINYLHRQGRLVQFLNLGTFYPLRTEYEDYMRWCADRFRDVVHYSHDVHDVTPSKAQDKSGKTVSFTISSTDLKTMRNKTWRARHVVIAVGGKPKVPAAIPQPHPRVIHSSAYLKSVAHLLPNREAHCRVVVIGSGQSAAEIFDDLQTRYPNASTALIIKGSALRPSDDSPFVNEVFDPCRVDELYCQPSEVRAASIAADRATNYGVVRIELLERLYEKMYQQRLFHPDQRDWKHRILTCKMVSGVEDLPGRKSVRLSLQDVSGRHPENGRMEETLVADAVVVATGYVRDAHEDILRSARHLMPEGDAPDKRWAVGRDYRIHMDARKISPTAGIWLQGCNESTHGLSDTLLSILAVRGGEIVESIFGRGDTNGEVYTNGFHDNAHPTCNNWKP